MRLAQAVKDPEASKKLTEMAEELRLYAERLEKSHQGLFCEGSDLRYRPSVSNSPQVNFQFP
jgi:hypothetical protein